MTDVKPSPPQPKKPKGPSRSAPAETEEEGPPRWVLPAVMITVLVLGGWFIIQNLSDTSKMEDCQMAGRKNCVAPIDTSNMR